MMTTMTKGRNRSSTVLKKSASREGNGCFLYSRNSATEENGKADCEGAIRVCQVTTLSNYPKFPFSISRLFVTIISPFVVEMSMPVVQTVRHSSIRPSFSSDCARA
jgi:hypothetical protein